MKQAIMMLLLCIILSSAASALLTPISRQIVAPTLNQTTTIAPIVKSAPVVSAPVLVQTAPKLNTLAKSIDTTPLAQKEVASKGEVDDKEFNSSNSQRISYVQPLHLNETKYCSGEDCTYYYDKQGRVIGYTENVTADSSPEKVRTFTHVLVYNNLSNVEKEIIIDHESGNVSDVEALNELFDGNDMGSIYQAMYSMLRQAYEQEKEKREEKLAMQEQKLQEMDNLTEQKEEKLQQDIEDAKGEYTPSILQRLDSFLSGKKYYYNNQGTVRGYTKGAITHFYKYDAEGSVEKDITFNNETGKISDKDALLDMMNSGNIDSLAEIVMFDTWNTEDKDLQDAVDEMHKMNKEKQRQREYAAFMKQQKSAANEQIKDEYNNSKPKDWLIENGSELAGKIEGPFKDTAKKGEPLGEKPGFLVRIWKWMTGEKTPMVQVPGIMNGSDNGPKGVINNTR